MKKYKCILFDMDGTFIDSRNFHARAYHRFFNKYCKSVEMDAVKNAIGPSTKSLFDNLQVPADDKMFDKLCEFYTNEADDLIRDIPVIKGAQEVFSQLIDKDYKIAVITNSMQQVTERILYLHNLSEYFSIVAGANQHSLDKRSRCADAIKALNANPDEVLLVGDMERDIEIANELGYDSCFTDTEIAWCEDYEYMLEALRPTYTIHTFEELTGIIE